MNNNNELQQKPHVVVVEASAGSGKTFTLARRYLELLINPQLDPREIPLKAILAITFTNKAALEMKERILSFLKMIALDSFGSAQEKQEIMKGLGVSEDDARAKAFLIMDTLLRNYNFFQVQTIDSFINALLCGCAFKLDLSAHFKTEREHAEYLTWSVDALIDRAQEDPRIRKLFYSFLEYYLHIERRSGWFPKKNIVSLLLNLFNKTNIYDGTFIRAPFSSDELIAHRRQLLQMMTELRGQLPRGTNATFVKSLDTFLGKEREGFSLDEVSNYFSYEAFPANKGVVVSSAVHTLWEQIRVLLGVVCEMEATVVFNTYVDIFILVMNDLKRFMSQDDVLFLESLNKEAHMLLDEKKISLPELYYRLATRFRHFLIDEFQDTSQLQWENLYLMIEEALSTGGSLFYVGDRKQAIYRFRGGDVSLIDTVREGFASFNPTRRSLTVNYRSLQEVVSFNNTLFSRENLQSFLIKKGYAKKRGMSFSADEQEDIISVFSGAHQEVGAGKQGGYVTVRFIEGPSAEDVRERIRSEVIHSVQELLKRFSARDIALLVRRNEEIELLTGWLLEEGIPVASEKTLNIRENPLIKEIISFLKFLNSPIDNLAFASFILGDIFAQASGVATARIRDFIFKQQTEGDALYLYRQFRAAFPDLWESLFEEFFKSVGFVPLYELLITFYARYSVLGRFAPYQGFLMRLLELVTEQEEKRFGLNLFLGYFDSAPAEHLYVNAAVSNAVKILTIHKAKGLEFPAVIVPFVYMQVKLSRPSDGNSIVVPDQDALRLFRLKQKYRVFSSRLDTLYRREYRRAFIDELNSLYVAFTRPKEELHILVPARAEKGVNETALLFPEGDCTRGAPRTKKKEDAQRAETVGISPSVYRDWIDFLKDEFVDEGVLVRRQVMARGELLHAVLAGVGNLRKKDASGVLEAAATQAYAAFGTDEFFQGAVEQVAGLLAAEHLKPYFERAGAEIFTEKELVDSRGRTFRLDRLIVTADEAIVIDYKSSKDEQGDYQEQVRNYMRLVRELYPKKKVSGVLLYLDTLDVEQVTPDVRS